MAAYPLWHSLPDWCPQLRQVLRQGLAESKDCADPEKPKVDGVASDRTNRQDRNEEPEEGYKSEDALRGLPPGGFRLVLRLWRAVYV